MLRSSLAHCRFKVKPAESGTLTPSQRQAPKHPNPGFLGPNTHSILTLRLRLQKGSPINVRLTFPFPCVLLDGRLHSYDRTSVPTLLPQAKQDLTASIISQRRSLMNASFFACRFPCQRLLRWRCLQRPLDLSFSRLSVFESHVESM